MDKDDLIKLLRLQEKEERVFKLLKEKEKILKEISQEEQKLKHISDTIEDILSKKHQTKEYIETLMKKIEDYQKMIKKIESSLKSVKSKEQYKNILREKSKTENAIINTKNMLKQASTLLISFENSKELKELELKRKSVLEEFDNLKEDLESIELSISKAQNDIKEYKERLDRKLLSFYEDMKKRVVPVFVPIDNRACSYCGTVLPLDYYNKLIQDNIYTFLCPNCQRIIYRQSDIIK